MIDESHNDRFDWVTKRSECVTFHVFKELIAEVETDVKNRNDLLDAYQKENHVSFKAEAATHDGSTFFVHRSGVGLVSSVTFKCDETEISAYDDNNSKFLQASLTLNDMGQCRLVVKDADGKELEISHWQFRRRALHNLFFGPRLLSTGRSQ
jgi:hypothetical protein